MKITTGNIISTVLRFAAFAVSAGFPISAIAQKFALWTESEGTSVSLGGGTVLIAIVALITFRKVIFSWVRERLGLNSCPPVVFWLIGCLLLVALGKIGTIVADLTTVCVAGLVGSGLGYFLAFAANVIERR